jgi:hypothetical protein
VAGRLAELARPWPSKPLNFESAYSRFFDIERRRLGHRIGIFRSPGHSGRKKALLLRSGLIPWAPAFLGWVGRFFDVVAYPRLLVAFGFCDRCYSWRAVFEFCGVYGSYIFRK